MSRPVRKLFVEGGGNDNDALKTECRRAFSTLLGKAGLKGRMPRIVACGSRGNAFAQFCTAVSAPEPGDVAMLLVDAEAPVTAKSPWDHVENRSGDGWSKPAAATDDHLHLMVQCMESWFLANRAELSRFFGQGFQETALPPTTVSLETVSKADLCTKLKQATRDTKKGAYSKGEHSFGLLARLDPALIRGASPWAKRFFAALDKLLV